MQTSDAQQTLRRELTTVDAVVLGLGSIVGTGVYVSLGFVIDLAGSMTLPAIFVAGLIALCNGMSSAQLAAVHPVAGGTYEYGYRFLGPWRARLAGWMFVIAKSASAATAALGAVTAITFVQPMIGNGAVADELFKQSWFGVSMTSVLALALVVVLGLLTHAGMRRTSYVNGLLVLAGVLPLLAFFLIVGVIPAISGSRFFSGHSPDAMSLGTAVAMAFVAFTGYGRVATLGEEVRNPRRTIPRSMLITLGCCTAIYLAVAWTCFSVASSPIQSGYTESQPLLVSVSLFSPTASTLYRLLQFGAVAAMLGVVLNLILGLSRVVLAMARRGDLPKGFAMIHRDGQSPGWAVLLVVCAIGTIAAIGGIRTSWTVSALTVLVYYALTNWAALKVADEDRFVPAWVSAAGLAGCVFFAPFPLYELIR